MSQLRHEAPRLEDLEHVRRESGARHSHARWQPDLPTRQVEFDRVPRLHAIAESLALDGRETQIDRVPEENTGERIREDRGDAEGLEGDRRLLTARTAAEVHAGHDHVALLDSLRPSRVDGLERVLPESPESAHLRELLSHFESSPITGIHLWFDRPISDLDHAVLLDRTVQWMFHKSRLHPSRVLTGDGVKIERSYIELVVSSSKSLIEKSRADIVDLALGEVREFFPAARDAKLIKSTVIKEVHATYSPRPGIDAYRPPAATVWPRVFLAGDWTATGWPATMEGAVRSGYLAAEALTYAAGVKDSKFLVPDLPATGLMRLFK